jgi:hypothetical protein
LRASEEEEEEEEEVPLTFWKVLGSRRYCSHQLLHHHHHHHHAASHMGMPANNFKIYLSGDFIMMGILRISPLLQITKCGCSSLVPIHYSSEFTLFQLVSIC